MIPSECLTQHVEDLIAGRREACQRTVTTLFDEGTPIRAVYEELFRDSLYEVGRRWEAGQVSVAVEHLATSITEELVTLIFPRALGARDAGRAAIVSCAADELHQIGGRIVADTLELLGFRVHFVGAGASLDELTSAVQAHKPDLLALSLSLEAHLPNVHAAIERVHAVAPDLPVIVGGRALTEGGDEALGRIPGVRCLATLGELTALVERWPVR